MKHAVPEPMAQPVAAWRLPFVLVSFGLIAAGLLLRAFYLQVIDTEFYRAEAAVRQVRVLPLEGHRGAIVDRRGEPLALSAPVTSIWVVPDVVLSAEDDTLERLADAVQRDPAELRRFLEARRASQFTYVKHNLSPEEAERILALRLPGVSSETQFARYYPAGEVASQVVGFAGRDNVGLEGIERAEEARLRGTPGRRRVIRDNQNRIIEDPLEYVPAVAGETVQLTLDLRVQYLAYRELKAAVAETRAAGGLIVVADARNGEILAMAAQPGFNPNNAAERSRPQGVRNRAVTDGFEPGSTIKPLLVAQALELGLYQPNSLIDVSPGYLKVGALTVRDVSKQGVVDLATMLAKSSNVGSAKIGLALGAENVWAGYQRFGLGERIGSGFPGEAAPVLRHFTDWGQIATATASYGYGLSVNALHLVRAYAGLANDGLMPGLSLVMGGSRPPPQRAVSAATAREVRRMMEAATVRGGGGTAQRAAFEGYRVAGKSGTVRKVAPTGGYDPNRHQAVFIGMVPVDQPRLVGLVMIDEPQGAYYGGQVAAPVFANVMQGAARLLQVPPDAPVTPAMTAALGDRL